MDYKEPLPDQCPPREAINLNDGLVVFRMIESEVPTSIDFDSHWLKNPTKRAQYLKRPGECLAKSVSVFRDKRDLEPYTKKPPHRGKKIGKLILNSGAGMLLEDNSSNSHCSYWPFRNYDLITNCVLADEVS